MPRFRRVWAANGWMSRARTGTIGSWTWSAFRLAEVRLRIPIVLVIAALVVGRWDVLRNYWDRLTAPRLGREHRPARRLQRHGVLLPDGPGHRVGLAGPLRSLQHDAGAA